MRREIARARPVSHHQVPTARRVRQRDGAWLQRTTTRLVRCRSIHALLALADDAVRAGLNFDRVGVFLVDQQQWALVGSSSFPKDGRDMLESGASTAQVLADPRMGADGPGFIYRAGAAVPSQGGVSGEQLLVSLRTADAVVGFLCVDNLTSGRPIGPDDAPPLVAFAGVLATALENVALLEERGQRIATLDADLRQRVDQLNWMQETTRQVNAAHTFQEALDVVYDSIHEGLGYDRVGVVLFDYTTGIFEEMVGTDDTGRKTWTSRTVTLSLDDPIWLFPGIATLLQGAEFYYSEAAYAECPPNLRYLLEGTPNHNIVVPLRAGERVTGMISVDNLTSGRLIVPAEVGPLLTLAQQVGTVIERARLQERERAEGARLAASEESLQTVMATMACGVMVVTPAGDISDANQAAQQILGQSLKTLRARPIVEALQVTVGEDGADLPASERPSWVALRTLQPQQGVVMKATLPNGRHCWLQVDAVPLLDAQGTLQRLVVSFIDITTRKQAEETLTHQALHDSLTGLPNRMLMADRLTQALLATQRTATPLALLLLDLDHFKEVNDTLGHAVGDLLLQAVTARIQSVLRSSDTVARLGGDEFAVLLPGADDDGASSVSRTILAALEAPFTVEEHRFTVEVSIGVAVSPAHGSDADTLLRHADVAMYAAKRGHLGYSVYAVDADPHTSSRLVLLSDLRESLAREQLLLYYQPAVHLSSGRPYGVEALLRWPHPRLGFVPPDQFIPLAEQTGILGPLTHWVLETGLRQCRDWHARGQPLRVAINLSPRLLLDPQISQSIVGLLHTYDLAPAQLTLEITESALMADPARALEVLTHLAGQGVRIAIDDFGKGQSSLSYLKRLPVHEVKIDKSFVLAMGTDAKDSAIVRAVIVLAHALGLEVVAEGVEDKATLDLLGNLGCDCAQGYYLSRPLPAAEVQAWMSASS